MKKKFQNNIRYLISQRKGYIIHFCRPTPLSLKNGHGSQKLFFAVILEKNFFFFKLLNKKYSKPRLSSPDAPFSSKWSNSQNIDIISGIHFLYRYFRYLCYIDIDIDIITPLRQSHSASARVPNLTTCNQKIIFSPQQCNTRAYT